MALFFCQHCTYRCSNWRNLIRHTFECHSSIPGFLFTCSLNGCKRTFKTSSAISSHINRDHTTSEEPSLTPAARQARADTPNPVDKTDTSTTSISLSSVTTDCYSDLNVTEDFDHPCEMDLDSGEEIIEESSSMRLQKAAARFILSLKEQQRLTQVAVNDLVSQVKEIVTCVIEDVREAVDGVLMERNLVSSSSDLDNICLNTAMKIATHSLDLKQSTSKLNSTRITSI